MIRMASAIKPAVVSQIATPPPSGVGSRCPLWPPGRSTNPILGATNRTTVQMPALARNAVTTRPPATAASTNTSCEFIVWSIPCDGRKAVK